MPHQPPTGPAPERAEPRASAPAESPAASSAPGVMTALICEQCGNENLIRVKGCWYCEKCRHKFDCYGW
jgi:hypothetical protein